MVMYIYACIEKVFDMYLSTEVWLPCSQLVLYEQTGTAPTVS